MMMAAAPYKINLYTICLAYILYDNPPLIHMIYIHYFKLLLSFIYIQYIQKQFHFNCAHNVCIYLIFISCDVMD